MRAYTTPARNRAEAELSKNVPDGSNQAKNLLALFFFCIQSRNRKLELWHRCRVTRESRVVVGPRQQKGDNATNRVEDVRCSTPKEIRETRGRERWLTVGETCSSIATRRKGSWNATAWCILAARARSAEAAEGNSLSVALVEQLTRTTGGLALSLSASSSSVARPCPPSCFLHLAASNGETNVSTRRALLQRYWRATQGHLLPRQRFPGNADEASARQLDAISAAISGVTVDRISCRLFARPPAPARPYVRVFICAPDFFFFFFFSAPWPLR